MQRNEEQGSGGGVAEVDAPGAVALEFLSGDVMEQFWQKGGIESVAAAKKKAKPRTKAKTCPKARTRPPTCPHSGSKGCTG